MQAEAIRKAAQITVDGVRLFNTIQATWNLLETSAGPALQEAQALGTGIIIKEALANGRLTDRNTDRAFAPRRAVLAREAARLHSSIDVISLAFCVKQPWVDIVLSGAATTDQLIANLAALEIDEEAAAQLAELAQPPHEYWEERKRMAWN